jgi:hypothetical protein
VTIQVTIKNDGGNNQIIGVIESSKYAYKDEQVAGSYVEEQKTYLNGGEEKKFTIWDSKELRIVELRNG